MKEMILFFIGFFMMFFINYIINQLFNFQNKKVFLLECFYRCLFVWLEKIYGVCFHSVCLSLIFIVLLVIGKIDYLTMNIYLLSVIILLVLVLCDLLWNHLLNIEILYGMLSVAPLMFVLNMIIPDSFGFGDIEVMLISGMLLGFYKNLVAMIIAVLLAGSYAFYLIVFKKAKRDDHFAFGPFLIIGIIVSLFYGQYILYWYFCI